MSELLHPIGTKRESTVLPPVTEKYCSCQASEVIP
jgi:hypothetical protein